MNCDVVVHLDDVTHNTNFPVNRATVLCGRYLTIPLPKKQRRHKIDEIEVRDLNWFFDHTRKVAAYYGERSAEVFERLVEHSRRDLLLDIIYKTISNTNRHLGLGLPKEVRSSSLQLTSTKNDRLIEICRFVNADTLVLGMGSKNYVESEKDKYSDSCISIEYQDWECPVEDYSVLHEMFTGDTKRVIHS